MANASKLSLVIILINNTQNVSEQETTAAYLIKGVIMDGWSFLEQNRQTNIANAAATFRQG